MEIILQIPDSELDELLSKYLNRITIPEKPEEPDIISLEEVCSLTGRRKPWVYKKTSEDNSDFPCQRFGRRLVFSRKDVLAWMKKNTVRKQPNEIVLKKLQTSASKKLR